ncbi:hypothetical protein NC653_023908 [Populus alba x Populus x berolinensis]|uniref:CN hydrolase domain-containing protein n=1 Tax=Populus alba x Populus x berolinensis TaxID=444605 RepID=A0AAD6MID2_9ROSI|nr:hypothetical protein NC653_023908 [Populus alba x Populus x berolinensis]
MHQMGFVNWLVRAAHKKGANIILIQWFLEEARAMALQDAEIVLYPTAIVSEPQDQGLDSRDHWKQVMQGHAGANLVSCCTGPAREIVAAADDKEEAVLVSKFDLEQIRLAFDFAVLTVSSGIQDGPMN